MFVTIEGLDGSGKTTVVESIKDKYPGAFITQEPTGSEYGQLARRNLSNGDSDAIVDFLLFMADRRNHVEQEIVPANEENKLVVCDRYADSTRAYQSITLQESGQFESEMHAKTYIEQVMAPWNVEPDLTIYIDVSVETALERMDGDEKYENRAFLEQVKENYDSLYKMRDRIVRVDGEMSPEAVATAAIGKLDVVAADRL